MTYGTQASTSLLTVQTHYQQKCQELWNIQKAEQITSPRLTVPRRSSVTPKAAQTPELLLKSGSLTNGCDKSWTPVGKTAPFLFNEKYLSRQKNVSTNICSRPQQLTFAYCEQTQFHSSCQSTNHLCLVCFYEIRLELDSSGLTEKHRQEVIKRSDHDSWTTLTEIKSRSSTDEAWYHFSDSGLALLWL